MRPFTALAAAACCAASGAAHAAPPVPGEPINPLRMYTGINRPVVVEVILPDPAGTLALPGPAPVDPPPPGEGPAHAEGPHDALPTDEIGPEQPAPPTAPPEITIALVDFSTGEEVDRAPAGEGRVDLAALFPVLWTTRSPRVLAAQVYAAQTAIGAPCVLQPMLTPRRADDALTTRVAEAVRGGNAGFLRQLLALPPALREDLSQQVVLAEDAPDRVYSGLRCYVDRQVVLETTAGTLRLALRPDAAPNTAFWFRHLAEHGAYDGTLFHRVIPEDLDGHPYLVQAGDPTGTGLGGVGMRIDFEAGGLRHDYAVLSMARAPDDPNSASSQFFICLSREACAPLDGLYTPFAEVVEGVQTLDAIAGGPVGPIDPSDPASRHERPLSPVEIERVRLEPAPPFGQRPTRIERPPDGAVER